MQETFSQIASLLLSVAMACATLLYEPVVFGVRAPEGSWLSCVVLTDIQCVFEKTHTSDQSIVTVSTTGKWSLTPWMRIGLQESFVAPRTKNPSKQASG
jgi:hypothetical protein